MGERMDGGKKVVERMTELEDRSENGWKGCEEGNTLCHAVANICVPECLP